MRDFKISIANNRKSKNWTGAKMTWPRFLEKLEKPARSDETQKAYFRMSKDMQSDLKDVGGFVGGTLLGNKRKTAFITGRDLITLDFDNIGTSVDKIVENVDKLKATYVIYSTRKHTSENPRLRIIFLLDRTVSVDEYEPIARRVAETIDMSAADPTTFEPARMMFWPSCSIDGEYVFKHAEYEELKADAILSTYKNWRDISQWPVVPGTEVNINSLLKKQEDPTQKTDNIIGPFCRTYDIYQAIEKFLSDKYTACDIPDRFTYVGGSTSAGAVVYQDGAFLYSHHATDPCGGKLVNSFDLVRLHLFGGLDKDKDVEISKLPSFKKMVELVNSDLSVIEKRSKELFEKLPTKPSEDAEASNNPDWVKDLKVNNKGIIQSTIENVVLILNNEPLLKNKIRIEEFSNRGMANGVLPWDSREDARIWSDVDDSQLRRHLEKYYGIKGAAIVEDAVKIVGFENRFNVVADYLSNLRWDGVNRIGTLLHDYLGAEQSEYSAQIMIKSLCAAVARALNGGVKFDNMVIMTGKQGIGKSTFLNKLGGNWFNDSLNTFEGKEAAELIQGSWIIEVGELSAMSRSEANAVKQFLSKQEDIYREAYGRRTNIYPRRCVFFGSTNDKEFLRDSTGNRRFWPIEVGVCEPIKSVFIDLDRERDMIWAEAVARYSILGENLYLTGEAAEIALGQQEQFRETSPKEGIIIDFLERPIPEDWYKWGIRAQRAYYEKDGEFSINDKDLKLVPRTKTCVAEVWAIAFGGDIKYLKKSDSNEIMRILESMPGWYKSKNGLHFGSFGKQKGIVRNSGFEYKIIKN